MKAATAWEADNARLIPSFVLNMVQLENVVTVSPE